MWESPCHGALVRSPPALLDLYIWLKKRRAAQGRVESLKRSLGVVRLYNLVTLVIWDKSGSFARHRTHWPKPTCILYSASTLLDRRTLVLVDEQFLVHSTVLSIT